ncbi:MAG TPA: (4Fe-4S)-binding protein [Myxococcales bacterium]|mgnify:FL=1|jgi:MinD superfamily P-loop ATPase|nr:(4Fe-4S)-binding protein [Myxococcales bacterium]
MKIAVASGKGGTGKTLIATHLARAIARAGEPVTYVDADVEAPNGHLFLRPEIAEERPVSVAVPAMVRPTCAGCGDCARACAFHAMLAAKDRVIVLPELCHSCGLCLEICPERVLEERPRRLGVVCEGRAGPIRFLSGVLDVGEARATPLISALASSLSAEGTTIIDAPPGTSCPAMEAVRAADLVVLVTEPTPFGLHDFELAVQMCRALGKRAYAVLNRVGLGQTPMDEAFARHGTPLVASIGFDAAISAASAEGRMADESSETLKKGLLELLLRLGEDWQSLSPAVNP